MGTEDANADYYAKGSEELATESALTIMKLEKRRKLTGNSKRLVIVLVGLPARGKSFIGRKLQSFLTWTGHACKIFNVGRYRRQAYSQIVAKTRDSDTERAEVGACDASFFDDNNSETSALREHVAELALRDMIQWLDQEDADDSSVLSRRSQETASTITERSHDTNRIAIFDATNSTAKRRRWILEECTSPAKRGGKRTGVVFVESICDDEELLKENYRYKTTNSPDFKGMSPEEALADLQKRVDNYASRYETIADQSQSYIKVFNLSTRLMVNHIYGRMAKTIVPALMAWNVGTRPVFLCRPGKTPHNVHTDSEDYVVPTENSNHVKKLKAENLGKTGIMFRQALAEFVEKEGREFMRRREEVAFSQSLETGTSRSGLNTFKTDAVFADFENQFPLTVMTSTMPRAVETVMWERSQFQVDTMSSLNPLDKGDFAGMELDEIQSLDQAWYSRLEQEPFLTRFPGGECYRDLISRLESVTIDIEQQVAPVLIVSHVSVLQALVSYFRNSPVDRCMSIEIPMHTVLKFEPSRGGGWMETQISFLPESDMNNSMEPVVSASELSTLSTEPTSPMSPIWGDHVALKS